MDFGLRKILDPDSLTTDMSSNVGTVIFKAPEFWSLMFGNKLKYHRNIDVYSAGLTSTAMLQVKPSQRHVPIAEGSMQASETAMPIGLASYTRMAYNQPGITVVVNNSKDDLETMKLKELIREMTQVCPQKRLSASMARMKIRQVLHVRFSSTKCTQPL